MTLALPCERRRLDAPRLPVVGRRKTFVRHVCFLVPILALATSCATDPERATDQMCAQLAAFAAATQPGQRHEVVLRGGWGGDTANVLKTHDCRHSGYAPAQALCAYLLPNTSWEFGHYNAKEAAACLDSAGRKDVMTRLDKGEVPVEITSSLQLLSDKRILLTVRLAAARPSASTASYLSVLTLSAESRH